MAPQSNPPQDLGLSIIGLGTQYPPNLITADDLSKLSAKHYPDTPAMAKVLSINQMTGIETRSSIGTIDHPLINQPSPPTISQLHEIFTSDGIPLAVSASRKALSEAGIKIPSPPPSSSSSQSSSSSSPRNHDETKTETEKEGEGGVERITHLVATTCTDSANPGFDHHVASQLGLSPKIEKVLLSGVGCSGGLATLRTAANLALGHRFRGKPARILCLSLEISTSLARSELESVDKEGETRIAACLFSDCASAAVLSNGVPFFPDSDPEEEEEGKEEGEGGGGMEKEEEEEEEEEEKSIYDLLGWIHKTIPDTERHLGFDVDPVGWKVVLTPEVPALATKSLPEGFEELKREVFGGRGDAESSFSSSSSSSSSSPPYLPKEPEDFDWALHPGGITILMGAERGLGITSQHMRASYDRYMSHGNSSSATIFSVLDRFREKDMTFGNGGEMMDGVPRGGRDYIVGAAFGPGISVEMCMLKRNPNRMGRMSNGMNGRRGSELDEGYDSQAVSEGDDGIATEQASAMDHD